MLYETFVNEQIGSRVSLNHADCNNSTGRLYLFLALVFAAIPLWPNRPEPISCFLKIRSVKLGRTKTLSIQFSRFPYQLEFWREVTELRDGTSGFRNKLVHRLNFLSWKIRDLNFKNPKGESVNIQHPVCQNQYCIPQRLYEIIRRAYSHFRKRKQKICFFESAVFARECNLAFGLLKCF